MLDFVSVFVLFLLAASGVSWVMYTAIQKGEILGKWQNVLDKAYNINPTLEQFLGGCFKCFSHLWALILFGVYILFCEQYLQSHFGWWYLLHYALFVPTSILFSTFMFNALSYLIVKNKELKENKDAV